MKKRQANIPTPIEWLKKVASEFKRKGKNAFDILGNSK